VSTRRGALHNPVKMQSSWAGITYTLTTWWTRVVFHWNAHILGVRIERTPFFALGQKRVSPSGWGCLTLQRQEHESFQRFFP
jgi:hypothetical protein